MIAKAPPLTEREREILRWLADGLQNKEIAQKLGISLATVRNHIHNMLEKLDVHSKLEAVSLAFRQGWVSTRPGELASEAHPRLKPTIRRSLAGSGRDELFEGAAVEQPEAVLLGGDDSAPSPSGS